MQPSTGECPDCAGTLTPRPVSVFTYTVNDHPYNPDVPTPYVIALIELSEQHDLRVAANIVDCEPDSVTCGMPVVLRPDKGAGGAPLFAPA